MKDSRWSCEHSFPTDHALASLLRLRMFRRLHSATRQSRTANSQSIGRSARKLVGNRAEGLRVCTNQGRHSRVGRAQLYFQESAMLSEGGCKLAESGND